MGATRNEISEVSRGKTTVLIYLMTYAALMFIRMYRERHFYIPVLIALFLFSAFRFQVGCDWLGYLNEFTVYGAFSVPDLLEERQPLWVSVFMLQNLLDLPYPWINVFSAFIFFWGMHSLARRQPDPLAFIILLFPILIINITMSAIRQAAAIGVLSMAFIAFIDRKAVRFVIITLVASTLHSSAILFLLFTPLVRGTYSRVRLILSALLAIPGLTLLLATQASEVAASRYVGTEIDAAGAVFRIGLLVLTGVCFLLFFRRNWKIVFPEDYKFVIIGSLSMVAVSVLLPFSSVIADRVGYYFIPVQTMILARLPYVVSLKYGNLVVAVPYLILLLVLGVWITWSTLFSLCYVPYQTWLFGFPNGRPF